MVVNVGRPGSVEGNESASIDGATEDIFWDEVSFIPSNNLASEGVSGMLALPYTLEPFPVRVVAVFKPLVDEDVGGIVVERFANEFAHLERRLRERRIMAHAHLGVIVDVYTLEGESRSAWTTRICARLGTWSLPRMCLP